jgi:membrane protein
MKKKAIHAGKRVKKMFVMIIAQFEDPYYQGVAAQIAFSLFLSIVPTLILTSQLLGLFSLSLDEIRNWIGDNVSVEGADQLLSFLEDSPSGANNIFLAVLALYAASRAQFALMRVTNYTFTDGRITGLGFVRDRLRSIKTILITIFTVVFSLVVLAYGELIINLVFGAVIGEEISSAAWILLRWPIASAMYFLMISYNYYILPSVRVRFRDIIPGSIFAAVGFLVVTYVYTIYISLSTNYDILYGSFSHIVVLMLWFWFLAWVMCLGTMFNRVWWATRSIDPIPLYISEEPREKRKPINIF